VVRKAFAEQYPQVVTAFLRVHQQKVDEFKQDPERAAAIVAKEVGAPVTTAANTLGGLEYPTLSQQGRRHGWVTGRKPPTAASAKR
jgi:taurine transport system substrate-binding protein